MAKKKVLLVDDEEDFIKIVKLNLEATGRYEVRMETKGSRALATARSFQPDIIFLDIVMPDKEGSEVATEIKSDLSLETTPIVFLTATVTADEVVNFRGFIGGQPFLAKPVSVEQLIEIINKYTP